MDLGPDRSEWVAHFGDFLFEGLEGYLAALSELFVDLLVVPVDGKIGQVDKVVFHVSGVEGVLLCAETREALAVDKCLKGVEGCD